MTTRTHERQVHEAAARRCLTEYPEYADAACWPDERSLYECLLDAADPWGDGLPTDPHLAGQDDE